MSKEDLAEAIYRSYNNSEIDLDLLPKLDLISDDLAGDAIKERINSLLKLVVQLKRFNGLLLALQASRPQVNWQSLLSRDELITAFAREQYSLSAHQKELLLALVDSCESLDDGRNHKFMTAGEFYGSGIGLIFVDGGPEVLLTARDLDGLLQAGLIYRESKPSSTHWRFMLQEKAFEIAKVLRASN